MSETTVSAGAEEAERKTESKTEKKPEKKRPTGEQYLYALFLCADWVPEEYRPLAASVEKRTEELKELYLCACDGIPAKKAKEALENKSPFPALKFLRMKKLEEEALSSCTGSLDLVAKKTEALEQEFAKMSSTLNQLTEHLPDMAALFPADPQEAQVKSDEQKKTLSEEPESGRTKGKDVPESGTRKKGKLPGKLKNLMHPGKRKNIAAFIGRMSEQGYTLEQMDFALDCFEEGMTEAQITNIISPNLPVGVMRRLRNMEMEKGGKTNG